MGMRFRVKLWMICVGMRFRVKLWMICVGMRFRVKFKYISSVNYHLSTATMASFTSTP